jgi:hypothetical protein
MTAALNILDLNNSEQGLHIPLLPWLQQIFSELNIDYQLVHTDGHIQASNSLYQPQIPAQQLAELIVLQDSLGKVQILIGHQQLLDLSQLCEQMGRNLQGISRNDLQSLLRPLGLDTPEKLSIPLPQLTELWVDQQLTAQDCLYFYSGLQNIYIQLSQDALLPLLRHAQLGDFGIDTARLLQNAKGNDTGDSQISRAVEQFTTLRIRQRLDQTIEIPPLPDTAGKIIRLRVDANASINDLAGVVSTDPSLAAQVVSWASSPFYGAPGGISSVQDAVVRVLGFDLVINLSLGLALGKSLRLPQDGPRGITPYWEKSVYAASLMQLLVKRMGGDHRPSIGLAYLSGLLHNFGYLVLNHIFPPHFSMISRYIEANPHLGHHIIEQQVLGVSREQISAWLMNVWQMPEEVMIALRWQQFQDYDGRHHLYSKLLFVTTQLLNSGGLGCEPAQAISEQTLNALSLSRQQIDDALTYVMTHQQELMSMARSLSH